MRSALLLAALLLSGCGDAQVFERGYRYGVAQSKMTMCVASVGGMTIEEAIQMFPDDPAVDTPDLSTIAPTLTNTGPHAVVLSDGERCLLLRPGESGVWSGPAEISTPDGYEVDTMVCDRYRRYTGEDQ